MPHKSQQTTGPGNPRDPYFRIPNPRDREVEQELGSSVAEPEAEFVPGPKRQVIDPSSGVPSGPPPTPTNKELISDAKKRGHHRPDDIFSYVKYRILNPESRGPEKGDRERALTADSKWLQSFERHSERFNKLQQGKLSKAFQAAIDVVSDIIDKPAEKAITDSFRTMKRARKIRSDLENQLGASLQKIASVSPETADEYIRGLSKSQNPDGFKSLKDLSNKFNAAMFTRATAGAKRGFSGLHRLVVGMLPWIGERVLPAIIQGFQKQPQLFDEEVYERDKKQGAAGAAAGLYNETIAPLVDDFISPAYTGYIEPGATNEEKFANKAILAKNIKKSPEMLAILLGMGRHGAKLAGKGVKGTLNTAKGIARLYQDMKRLRAQVRKFKLNMDIDSSGYIIKSIDPDVSFLKDPRKPERIEKQAIGIDFSGKIPRAEGRTGVFYMEGKVLDMPKVVEILNIYEKGKGSKFKRLGLDKSKVFGKRKKRDNIDIESNTPSTDAVRALLNLDPRSAFDLIRESKLSLADAQIKSSKSTGKKAPHSEAAKVIKEIDDAIESEVKKRWREGLKPKDRSVKMSKKDLDIQEKRLERFTEENRRTWSVEEKMRFLRQAKELKSGKGVLVEGDVFNIPQKRFGKLLEKSERLLRERIAPSRSVFEAITGIRNTSKNQRQAFVKSLVKERRKEVVRRQAQSASRLKLSKISRDPKGVENATPGIEAQGKKQGVQRVNVPLRNIAETQDIRNAQKEGTAQAEHQEQDARILVTPEGIALPPKASEPARGAISDNFVADHIKDFFEEWNLEQSSKPDGGRPMAGDPVEVGWVSKEIAQGNPAIAEWIKNNPKEAAKIPGQVRASVSASGLGLGGFSDRSSPGKVAPSASVTSKTRPESKRKGVKQELLGENVAGQDIFPKAKLKAIPVAPPEIRKFWRKIQLEQEARGIPGLRPDVVVLQEAEARLRADYELEYRNLSKPRTPSMMSDVDVAVAKQLIVDKFSDLTMEELVQNPEAVTIFNNYDASGTIVSRGLRQRHDPIQTPRQRRFRMLRESIMRSKPKTMKALREAAEEGNMKAYRDILRRSNKERVKMVQRLKAQGLSDKTMAEISESLISTVKWIKEIEASKSSIWDAGVELFIANILSGVGTPVVNLFSTAAHMTYRQWAHRTVQGAMHDVVRKYMDNAGTDILTKEATLKELPYVAAGMKPGWIMAKRNAALALKLEYPVLEYSLGLTTEVGMKIRMGKSIGGLKGRLIRLPGLDMLVAGDELLRSIDARMHAGGLAFRKAFLEEGLRGPELQQRISDLVEIPSERATRLTREKEANTAGEKWSRDVFEMEVERRLRLPDKEMKDTIEIWEKATETSKIDAFQKTITEPVTNLAKAVKGARKNFFPLNFVFPFIHTTMSIFEQGFLHHSPLNIPAVFAELGKQGLKHPSQRNYSRFLDLTGNAGLTAAGIYILAATNDPTNPWITGAQEAVIFDENKQARLRVPQYHIWVPGWIPGLAFPFRGGHFRDYSKVEPFATGVAYSVDVGTALRGSPSNTFNVEDTWYTKSGKIAGRIADGLGSSVLNIFGQMRTKTFMTGMTDIVRVSERMDATSFSRWSTNLGTGFIPWSGLIKSLGRASRTHFSERRIWGSKADKSERALIRAVQSMEVLGPAAADALIWLLNGVLPGDDWPTDLFIDVPKRDIWGRKILRTTHGIHPLTDFFHKLASPIKETNINIFPAQRLLQNWNLQNPEEKIMPLEPSTFVIISGKKHFLSDLQYERKAALQGKQAALMYLKIKSWNEDKPTAADKKMFNAIRRAASKRASDFAKAEILLEDKPERAANVRIKMIEAIRQLDIELAETGRYIDP